MRCPFLSRPLTIGLVGQVGHWQLRNTPGPGSVSYRNYFISAEVGSLVTIINGSCQIPGYLLWIQAATFIYSRYWSKMDWNGEKLQCKIGLGIWLRIFWSPRLRSRCIQRTVPASDPFKNKYHLVSSSKHFVKEDRLLAPQFLSERWLGPGRLTIFIQVFWSDFTQKPKCLSNQTWETWPKKSQFLSKVVGIRTLCTFRGPDMNLAVNFQNSFYQKRRGVRGRWIWYLGHWSFLPYHWQ